MPALTLYSEYSRKDVHDIFSPETRFTQSSGSWGLHGIVEIPNKPGDFVFFVTFGQHQAGHTFDEWITEEGMISWQSQPRQSFEDRRIQQFIHHDDGKNAIHLFLRTQRTANYTYLGKLRYLAHDPARARPVYMYWQLLNWPIPVEALDRLSLKLQPAGVVKQVIRGMPDKQRATFERSATEFNWHGNTWQVDRDAIIAQVISRIDKGLPEEATRFRDWYIEIDHQQISPKWLFHLITGADFDEFDAIQARDKLAQIGIISTHVNKKDDQYHGDGITPSRLDIHSLKSKDRKLFFQTIASFMKGEYPEIFGRATIHFLDRGNWVEIHFPDLKGYYRFRLAREFDEFAYFFPGNPLIAHRIVEELTPNLDSLSNRMGFSVRVIPQYWKTWGRLGFEIPYDYIKEASLLFFGESQDDDFIRFLSQIETRMDDYREKYDIDKIEVIYAWILVDFIQATYGLLGEIPGYLGKGHPRKITTYDETNQVPNHILELRIKNIRNVLAGVAETPPDEVICDWVHFCYDFGLYQEGQLLFTFVTSEQVNPWYYERTKKLARLCAMKAAVKG